MKKETLVLCDLNKFDGSLNIQQFINEVCGRYLMKVRYIRWVW
jgi:hypothetical protein